MDEYFKIEAGLDTDILKDKKKAKEEFNYINIL